MFKALGETFGYYGANPLDSMGVPDANSDIKEEYGQSKKFIYFSKNLTMATVALKKRNQVIESLIGKAAEWIESSFTNFDKIAFIKKGISKDSLVSVKQTIDVDYDHLSQVLGTTKTTLHKKQGDETFSASISEKVVALMDIYRFGYEVFGDRDKFNKWVINQKIEK